MTEDSNKQSEKYVQEKPKRVGQIPFLKLFRFATRQDKWLMAIGFIAAFGNGLAMPLFSLVFGEMIDAFGPTNTKQQVLDESKKQSMWFVILGVITFVLSWVQMYTWMVAGERQGIAYRKNYFKAILQQDVAWFDKINPNQLASKVATECFAIQGAIGEKVPTFVMSMSMLLGGFGVAYVRGWELSLICTAGLPMMALAGFIFTYQLQNAELLVSDAYQDAGGLAEQAIGGIKTVQSLNGQNHELAIYESYLQKAYKIAVKYGLYIGMGLGFLQLAMTLFYAIGFYFGSRFVGNKTDNAIYDRPYSAGDVIVIFFSIMFGGFSLGQATPCLKNFTLGQQAAFAVFSVLDSKPSISPSLEKGKQPAELKGHILLKDVEFTYPTKSDVQVLKKINVEIKQGQKTALVGESGCGKSTIMQLIERYYDADKGEVLVDGNNIKDLNLKWMRKHVGYVGQEPVLFATSIRENLKFGKPDATEEEMIEALKQANAYEFVIHLQDKLDTFVGTSGSQLSGGQKQRLCIARAILKNPQVLLLDEATSALDRRNEKSIQETLDEISKNRTTIVIAHRLSTIQNADNILVIDNGKLIEQGNHESLLKLNGKYAALSKNQMQQEKEEEQQLQEEENSNGENSGSDLPAQGVDRKVKNKAPKKQLEEIEEQMKRSRVASHTLNNASALSNKEIKELKAQEKKENSRILNKLYQINRPERPWMFVGAFFSAVAGGAWPLLGAIQAYYIDVLGKVDVTSKDEFDDDSERLALWLVLLAVVSFLAMTFQFASWRKVSEGLTMRLRSSIFNKILNMPVSWFDIPENNPGTLTSRLGSDTQLVNGLTSTVVNLQINNLSSFLTGIIIGFVYDWRTTLVSLFTFPIMFAAGAIQAQFTQGFSELTDAGYKDSGSLVQESVTNIRTVTSFANEEQILSTYDEKLVEPLKVIAPKGNKAGFAFGLSQMILYLIFSLLFYASSQFQYHYGTETVDMFVALFALMYSAFGAGNNNQFMTDVGAAYNAAKNLFIVLETKDQIQQHKESHPKQINSGTIRGDIRLENVSFKYPSREKIILKNVSLQIKAGEKVAFVGPSGCGKSTIMQLLLRFYEPLSGKIYLDGKEIHEYEIDYLRKQLGVVSQEPILFQGTIQQNIRYNTDSIDFDKIVSAAKQANAHDFIEKNQFEPVQEDASTTEKVDLGNGYNRQVGLKGNQLSGGQKQRIAIARAIIKEPKILLLDEATSALDSQNEVIVQESLDKMMKNKTTLAIAHRISTIKDSNTIFVIEDGNLVEQGNYEQLQAKKGYFYRLERGEHH